MLPSAILQKAGTHQRESLCHKGAGIGSSHCIWSTGETKKSWREFAPGERRALCNLGSGVGNSLCSVNLRGENTQREGMVSLVISAFWPSL
ncbi:EXO5 isoform 11 [Pongo abelii]|uniref:EXO5 isoform 11 n=1 Tax=Pongo abelii TaxID=9601 RepID=A0A2J8Y655_PONAB|nr:EXO5 isoform 11 [Pongo abelii]